MNDKRHRSIRREMLILRTGEISLSRNIPSHAATVMELGFDAVLLNTAVAKAGNPAAMVQDFSKATQAGREAFRAGLMKPSDFAVPSTPVIGKAVFS